MAKRNPEIDIGLAALCQHAEPRQVLSLREIADVCGCDKSRIEEISKVGLRKLRNKLTNKEDYLDD